MFVSVCLPVPVSKPAVSQMCLSPEQMNISCSAEGDRVEFILTLDSLLLMQTRGNSQSPSSSTMNTQSPAGSKTGPDKASVSTVTISLNGQLTGNLMCQVWNNVGKEETVIQLKRCQGTVFKGSLHFYFKYQLFTNISFFKLNSLTSGYEGLAM